MKPLLVLAAFIALLSLAGHSDYEDAKAQAAHYNSMVCNGHWPDYEQRKPECEK